MFCSIPGHRIAPWATAPAAVGATILSGQAQHCPVKMVGPRASLRRDAGRHHAWTSVSQDRPT